MKDESSQMELKLKVTKNFDLSKLKIDLSQELNVGIKLIQSNIAEGIHKGGNFGRAFQRNAESTIKRKGFDHPLRETGLMMNPTSMMVSKASRSRQRATLLPNENRITIAYWNQNGTATIPSRFFWGISEHTENRIMNFVEKKIDRLIDAL